MTAPDRPPTPLVPLVRAAVAGDAAALERLLIEVYTPTRKFLQGRYHGLRAAAAFIEDVMQETLIRVADRVSECSCAGDPSVRNWVLEIAENAAAKELRSNAGRIAARVAEELDVESIGVVPALPVRQELVAEDPADEAEADDEVTRTLHALTCRAQDQLTEPAVAIMWHRLVEGASWKCVAAELRAREPGLTVKAVINRYQRAQTRLRKVVLGRIAVMPAPERTPLERRLEHFHRRRRRRKRRRGEG